jgi:hypothetical protein
VVLGLAAAVEEEEGGLGLVAVEVVDRCLQLQVMVVVIAKEHEVNSMESDEIVSRHSVTHDQENLHGVSVVVMMMKSHHCLVILVVTC